MAPTNPLGRDPVTGKVVEFVLATGTDGTAFAFFMA